MERVRFEVVDEATVRVLLDDAHVGFVEKMDRMGWAFRAHTVSYATRPTREEAEEFARTLVQAWGEHLIVWTDTTRPVSPGLPAGTMPHFTATGTSLFGRRYSIGYREIGIGHGRTRKAMALTCCDLATSRAVNIPFHVGVDCDGHEATKPARDREFALHKERAATFEARCRSGSPGVPVREDDAKGETAA